MYSLRLVEPCTYIIVQSYSAWTSSYRIWLCTHVRCTVLYYCIPRLHVPKCLTERPLEHFHSFMGVVSRKMDLESENLKWGYIMQKHQTWLLQTSWCTNCKKFVLVHLLPSAYEVHALNECTISLSHTAIPNLMGHFYMSWFFYISF